MEYWSAKTARLVDAEADAATPTVDENGKQTPSAEEIQRIKSELSDAFEQLTKAAALCTPYFHAKLQNIELGGEIDLGRLSYEELSTIVPLLRKAQALAIEDRSEEGEGDVAGGGDGTAGGDGQQQEGSGSAASVDARPDEVPEDVLTHQSARGFNYFNNNYHRSDLGVGVAREEGFGDSPNEHLKGKRGQGGARRAYRRQKNF